MGPRPGWKKLLICVAAAAVLHAARAEAAEVDATASGLVGYWALDEGRGDTAANTARPSADVFGNSGSARVLAPVWVKGKHGTALDFSGGRSVVMVEKTKELDCPDQVTIAAWVRLENPTARGLILNHEYAYRLGVNLGKKRRVRLQLNLDGNWAGNWLTGKTSLETGRWYHLAGVFDGRQRRIYIDGRLDAEESVQGRISQGRHFTIGAQAVQRKAKHRSKHGSKRGQAAGDTVSNPFPGVLDEVKVWNRSLSDSELARAAAQDRPQLAALLPPEKDLYFYTVRCVGMLGRETPCRVAVFNGGTTPYRGTLAVRIAAADGSPLHTSQHPLQLASRRGTLLSAAFRAPAAGVYRLVVDSDGRPLHETPVCVLAPYQRQPVGEPALKKVLHVDLARELGPETLCDDGTSRVVRSEVGVYREAGPKQFSRFVVRLPLRRTGLHLVRLTYPDDKPRTCEIASWSPVEADRFNAHTGYFTGDDYPISGRMQTFEFVIWARDVNQALVFTTWLEGQPAAASTIDVFAVDGRLPSRPASRLPSRRLIGHYWEDAQPLSRCFGGDAPDPVDFDRVACNLCDYFDYTGQNVLMHPVVWYEGPIYNSLVEARGGKGGFHLPTDAWVDILLARFGERGFKFYGLLNVHQLPSLVRRMNADDARVRAGEPTFNTVSKDNRVATRTWHHLMPMFNALHPRVQARVLVLVKELADRYGDRPAFAGLGFHLTLAQLLQPGSLDVSYDDWTVGAFTADTGLTVPVDPGDPQRFGKRYQWIMANAREEWIGWRCRRMADYYGRVAKILRDKRDDLQLVVTILEPPMSIIDPQRLEWMGGKRLVEMAREGGIDPALLAEQPGVVLQQRLGPTAKRKRLTFGTTRGRWGCPPPTAENIDAIRKMDLDADQQKEFRTTADFGVFLYNRYFESAVGKTQPLECDWYQSIPWRATAVVPGHDHFMEYYARAMAMFDPTLIAVGGFTNGTVGHEAQVERFARVFRQLPAGRWEEIAGLGDGLAGRTTRCDDRQYVYVVNQTWEQRRVALKLKGDFRPLGGSPELGKDTGGQAVVLGPYQLAAWVER